MHTKKVLPPKEFKQKYYSPNGEYKTIVKKRYDLVCLTSKNVTYSHLLDSQKSGENIQGIFGISLRKEEHEPQDLNKVRQDNFLISEKLKLDLKKLIIQLLDGLKDFWQKLIDGYPSLEFYMKQVLQIIDKIIKTKQVLQMTRQLHIQQEILKKEIKCLSSRSIMNMNSRFKLLLKY